MNEKKKKLNVIPLGGLGEVGRNMTLIECDNYAVIIDMGLKFPGEDMPGIDLLIPNITYLNEIQKAGKKILGVLFTHGHYDHIGAVPYIIGKIGNPPMYASGLAKGIIVKRQEEFPNQPQLKMVIVKDGSKINLGPFKIEFFRQNHNIPDNLGIFIETPYGNIMHTSDFKFDETPINDLPTDFKKIEEFGRRNVTLLMSDSTGAEEEGHSLSEKTIEKNLEEIFKKTNGRIIAATFSSLLNRIQQMITLSEKYGRKVAIEGYSMKTNVEISKKLGYLKSNSKTIIQSKDIEKYPDSQITILCTGAQGEDRAALMKIINRDHRFLSLKKGDTIVLSSSVIPGNERTVQALKDNILMQGSKIFHYKMMDIHAGGHAQQEELKEMLRMVKPKFLMPIHGQYSMMISHKEIAVESKILPEKNVIIAQNGNILNLLSKDNVLKKETVPANQVMVDGLGVGDIGEIVLRDRHILARDGMFVIIVAVSKLDGKVQGSPDIISRGFVYLRESKELLKMTRKKVIQTVHEATNQGGAVNWNYVKDQIRNNVGEFLYQKTQRRPMVLPVVIEV